LARNLRERSQPVAEILASDGERGLAAGGREAATATALGPIVDLAESLFAAVFGISFLRERGTVIRPWRTRVA